MKVLMFLILAFGGWAADVVIVSQPKLVYTSVADFTSVSNSGLTTHFLTCGNSRYKVLSVKLTFSTTGKVDICKVSGVIGTCSTAGSTANTSALDTNPDDVVYLGYNPSLQSYSASEVTTFTKIDGSFTAERNCVGREYLQ